MNDKRGIGAAAVLIFRITAGTRASASLSSNIQPAFIANFQNDSVIEFRPTTTKIENFFNVKNKETVVVMAKMRKRGNLLRLFIRNK